MDNYGSDSRPDEGDGQQPAAGPVADGTSPPPDRGSPPAGSDAPANLAGPLIIYSVLRVGLIAALTAVLAIFMPLIVALIFAIVVQLPLAWILFAGPRRKVNDAIATRSAARRGERQRLQSALSGEEPLA